MSYDKDICFIYYDSETKWNAKVMRNKVSELHTREQALDWAVVELVKLIKEDKKIVDNK